MNIKNIQPLSFETSALTDVGIFRTTNEDSLFAIDRIEPNSSGPSSFGIYLVADGMGGHQAGEIASEIANKTISQFLLDNIKSDLIITSPCSLVKQAMELANRRIFDLAMRIKDFSFMGTTVTLGFRINNSLYIGHAGDSRAYLIREGKIKQLTDDHSLVGRLLKEGIITPDEVRTHPDKGKIFRFLGASENINIDNRALNLYSGDILVFCSDGLTSCLSDYEIQRCVNDNAGVATICRKLIDKANSRGGEDNSSVIVVNFSSGAKADHGH